MTRTLIAALLLPFAGFAGEALPVYETPAPFPSKQGFPVAPLVESRVGGIYGVFNEVRAPGAVQAGGIFRFRSVKGKCDVLHRFIGSQGYEPLTLVSGEDGVLLGTCQAGGEFQEGTIWSFNLSSKNFRKIADLPPSRGNARISEITTEGILYGTVDDGVFRCGRNGDFGLLYDFIPVPPAPPPQGQEPPPPPIVPSNPQAIVLGSDGDFYGTTESSGPSGSPPTGPGVFFSVTDAGVLTQIESFSASTGGAPTQIMEGSDGAFYGLSTVPSGDLVKPVLLRMAPQAAAGSAHISVVYDFDGATFSSDVTLQIFKDSGVGFLLAVSRTSTQEDPADLVVRFDPDTQTGSEVFRYVGEQRGGNLVVASDGKWYGAYRIPGGPGFVTTVSGLGQVTNLPPFARPDRVELPVGAEELAINPLKNDGDDNGDELTIVDPDLAGKETENGGTIARAADNPRQLIYTPKDDTVVSDRFTYTIADGEGENAGTATARVVIVRAGPSRTYAGLFNFRGVPTYLRATISNAGQLTGVIYPVGRRITLRGSLDLETRTYEKNIDGFNFPVDEVESESGELKIELEETLPASTSTSGSLEVTATFNAHTETVTLGEIVTEVDVRARYALTFPPFDPLEDSELEQPDRNVQIVDPAARRPKNLGGAGWAILKVSESGSARLIGKLSDGRTISFGGPFSDAETLPVYAWASRVTTESAPRGFFAGELEFGDDEAEGAENDCSAIFRWTRPSVEKGPFKLGFAILQPAAGFRFLGSGNGSNGGPDGPDEDDIIPIKIQLGAIPGINFFQAIGTFQGNTIQSLELDGTVRVSGGDLIASGTFRHPQLASPSRVSGLLIQRLNQVIGFYKTPLGTGHLVIKPE